MKERLKKLEELCHEIGVKKVAHDLGYNSKHTVYHWLRDKKIPPLAWEKVDSYLEKALQK